MRTRISSPDLQYALPAAQEEDQKTRMKTKKPSYKQTKISLYIDTAFQKLNTTVLLPWWSPMALILGGNSEPVAHV